MKTLKTLILSLLALFSFSAMAAGSATGTVLGFFAAQGSVMLVYPSVAITTPACSAGRFAIDTSTTNGQNQAAAIRFAAALGKTVTFYGAGTCNSTFTDTETITSIYIAN